MTEVPKFLLERRNDLSASVSEQETRKRDNRRRFTTSFCENDGVAKASLRDVGDLVFLQSLKG